MRSNTDLTLYNKYYDTVTKADLYQRTVIKAVSWENREAANTLAVGGRIAANKAVIYIPKARGTNFYKPKAWLALVDKTVGWTLQDDDILVKGEVADVLSSLFLPTALKAKYDDVLSITSIDLFDMGSLSMQHWQIGAK